MFLFELLVLCVYRVDSKPFGVFVHEIGHALGLGHAGNYNASEDYEPTYAADAEFLSDSWQTSVMSYWDQEVNTYIDASRAERATPMIADIIAIQNLYGVPTNINVGDTVYGYGSNVGGYLGRLFAAMSGEDSDLDIYAGGPVALTLHDNAGNDTLDLQWDTDDQRVDLRPEAISDVLGLTGNLIIAGDTVIENFVAGSGNDHVVGNDAANRLEGRTGNDTLHGESGDDVLEGGDGNDRLDGGADGDTVSYQSSDAGVRVHLRSGAASGGHAEGDTFQAIEHLEGSAHPDVFVGNGAANRLSGDAGDDRLYGDWGDDTLEGGAGSDLIHGGGGADTASYAGSSAGVTVDLSTGTASGGDAAGDTLRSIERINRSRHADTLAGSERDETLAGGAGADSMDGGDGDDWLWYGGSDAGVDVSLLAGTASGGHAEGDTFRNVEAVGGCSPVPSTIVG